MAEDRKSRRVKEKPTTKAPDRSANAWYRVVGGAAVLAVIVLVILYATVNGERDEIVRVPEEALIDETVGVGNEAEAEPGAEPETGTGTETQELGEETRPETEAD